MKFKQNEQKQEDIVANSSKNWSKMMNYVFTNIFKIPTKYFKHK